MELRLHARLETYRARHWMKIATQLALCLATSLIGLGGVSAQEASASIRLELNRLEPQGENCRTYFLVKNPQGGAIKSLKVDLFILDLEGIAQRRIAVELGPMPANKALIKLFDVPNHVCSRFGTVLLNGVLACEGESGPLAGCLERIETASKVDSVSFSK